MRVKMILWAAVLALTAMSPAAADEQVVPLAESGTWVALAHRPSITGPTDVCLATNMAGGETPRGIAFRASDAGVEFRVMDPSWSLPAGVHGAVAVMVGNWSQSFNVNYNTSNVVSVEIPEPDLLSMFAKMDEAAEMTVKVGTAKPFPISLIGSTRATDAFRTCAGIRSNSQSSGSNPFD